jgi:hypothetical protein
MAMGLKGKLTPLRDSGLLDESAVERLKSGWITTVEELFGALESDPKSIATLLGLSDEAIDSLKERARSALDERFSEAVEEQRTKRYSYGAWNPANRKGKHGD